MICQSLGRAVHDSRMRFIANELMKRGFALVSERNHLKFRHQDSGQVFVISKTTSDTNAWKRVVSEARKHLGIDLADAVRNSGKKKRKAMLASA